MPNASPSVLRRALARMLQEIGGTARVHYQQPVGSGARALDATLLNTAFGGAVGGAGGVGYSALGGAEDADDVAANVGTGAAIGAGAGLGRVALRGAGGFGRGLREAIAERVGRNATNVADRGAASWRDGLSETASPEMRARIGDFRKADEDRMLSDRVEDLVPGRYRGGEGIFGARDPMVASQEKQIMRDQLRQLRAQRRQATSQEELDDINQQIAVLRRDLGLD